MAAMTIVGVLGMLGTIGSSGIKAQLSAQNIRDSIGTVEETTRDWQAAYQKLQLNEEKEAEDLKAAIIQLSESYGGLQTKLDLERTVHAAQLRTIQLIGIIFITIIFLLLLLKQFNLLGPLIHAIGAPERWLWNYLFHGGKKK